MNKLPLSTALLSALGAVVLWYIAMLLEDRIGQPAAEPGPAALPEFGPQVEDSPVVGGDAAQRCREAEQTMLDAVEESRHCETDADCTIFDYGYPIQCLTSVARTEITHLRLTYREYEASCEYRVYYDCPAEPMEREPVCRNNRCEVELRRRDFLQDETLEFLGIDEAGDSGG